MKFYSNFILFCLLNGSASSNLKGSRSSSKEEVKEKIDQVFGTKTERSANKSTIDGDLPTDGYCWIHEYGKFCFEKDRFQSISIADDELFVEEFFDGKKYSYSLQNVEQLHLDYQLFSSTNSGNRKLEHAMTDTSWLDSLDGIKYGCQVEEFGSFSTFHSTKELLVANADSSSIWRFQDWIVYVDSDMVPISILTLTDEDENEETLAFPFEVFTSVSAVETISSTIKGCDFKKDSELSPDVSSEGHERLLQIVNAHDPSISDEDYFKNLDSHRRLVPQWVTDFTASASNTQWCGPGTDVITTPCPNPNEDFDFNADNACRRHDHGKLYKITSIGLPRLECFVDYQINQAGGHNWALNAVYGKWGGASILGCYNYESYKCWKRVGWKIVYTTCGKKWKTKYGPNRYNNNVKTVGYKSKEKHCEYDYLVPF